MADTVLVLGNNGGIIEQGPFENLKEGQGFIANSDLSNEIISQDVNAPVDGDAENGSPGHAANETEPMQRPDMSVWRFYFDAMGWTRIILLCVFLSIEAGFGAFRYVWLAWWSASDDAIRASRVGYWIGIYATFGVLETTGLALAIFWTWVFIVPAASSKLHSLILTATMGASIPFLSNTETGPLVNGFTTWVHQYSLPVLRHYCRRRRCYCGAALSRPGDSICRCSTSIYTAILPAHLPATTASRD